MTVPREHAVEIWTAGVDAVRAAPLVHREVQVDGDQLWIGHHEWSRDQFDRVLVVGAGKAGAAMTQGLLQSIAGWLPIAGWVNVPAGTEKVIRAEQETGSIHLHPARSPGVNEPTPEGVLGAEQILRLVQQASPRDLCIALISGGGSALLPAPCEGITLDDKLAVTRWLSAAGAEITDLNIVRKHLSRIKGGGLLSACRSGALVTLVLSDVLGDPLDLIASGPTVVDTSQPAQALEVLDRFDPSRQLPHRIYDVLHSACERPRRRDVTTDHTTVVIGNNAVAVDGAGIRAERLGYNHTMQSARRCEGFAEDVGRHLAEMTVRMLRADPAAHRSDCLITGGEPVVQLAPADQRGLGGRNQQLVLAAYQHLLTSGLSAQQWERLCLMSGGTDGEDGPTDAAGAVMDAAVHRRATELRLDVAQALRRNDAYTFFHSAGGLLQTGPTGTNVCDVRVALVRPPQPS